MLGCLFLHRMGEEEGVGKGPKVSGEPSLGAKCASSLIQRETPRAGEMVCLASAGCEFDSKNQCEKSGCGVR